MNKELHPEWQELLEKTEAAARSGDPQALMHWLGAHEMNKLQLPDWLFGSVYKILLKLLDDQRTKGRTGNRRAKYQQSRIHEIRWATVLYLRWNSPDRAKTWPQTFSSAADDLRGTQARGSPEAIRRSYKLFRRTPEVASGVTDYDGHPLPEWSDVIREIYEMRKENMPLNTG